MLGHFKVLALGLGFTTAVSAIGKAVVVNNCHFPVTLWSVGSDISPSVTLNQGKVYKEKFMQDPKTGGKAIKISLSPDGLHNGASQTIFAYNLKDGTVWYDLTDVFGDPFSGHKLAVYSSNAGCSAIVFAEGVPGEGSHVKSCGGSSDVTLTLCAK